MERRKDAGGNGDENDVVNKCKKKILSDGGHGGTADSNGPGYAG